MIDYQNTIQKLLDSVKDFTFDLSFEEVKSKMELKEVPNEELLKLGEGKVKEYFANGTFIIKVSDQIFLNSWSLNKYCQEKGIQEPILVLNPNFKFVRWEITEDLITPQIRKYIKHQLTKNDEIDFDELHKALVTEDIKNNQVVGYLNKLPLKTSNIIQEGKFYMHSTCSNHHAMNLIIETISEIQDGETVFIKSKIKKDRINSTWYAFFIIVILTLWLGNNYCKLIPTWLSIIIGVILYLVPLMVMRLIDHSFIKSVLFRKKAELKYKKEYYNKTI